MSHNIATRPPIGFIVEGEAEYHSYRSFTSRILDESEVFVPPPANSRGANNVLRNLSTHLSQLVKVYHPFSIIVTTDLRDHIEQRTCSSCDELVSQIHGQIDSWISTAGASPRLHPLPECIVAVIQIQSFESWLISDLEGLLRIGFLVDESATYSGYSDGVSNPAEWLRDKASQRWNIKNPNQAYMLAQNLDIETMRSNCESFDKFSREILRLYQCWYDRMLTDNQGE